MGCRFGRRLGQTRPNLFLGLRSGKSGEALVGAPEDGVTFSRIDQDPRWARGTRTNVVVVGLTESMCHTAQDSKETTLGRRRAEGVSFSREASSQRRDRSRGLESGDGVMSPDK